MGDAEAGERDGWRERSQKQTAVTTKIMRKSIPLALAPPNLQRAPSHSKQLAPLFNTKSIKQILNLHSTPFNYQTQVAAAELLVLDSFHVSTCYYFNALPQPAISRLFLSILIPLQFIHLQLSCPHFNNSLPYFP
ncbi:hypothetical protein V6N13_060159 [Hibiscus sabdariffa]|uniref:Uncharacterized protein n=1 Tax=Hibiscus sabdariffa TaxID=183260 RepID=A0ABR2GBS6_9ROSI